MSAGQTITGACASVTVPVKLHGALLPAASVTTKVLVVTPTANNEPGDRKGVWKGKKPDQVAGPTVEKKLTVAPHAFGSVFWVMSAGQTITGACASVTVTVKLHGALLPAAARSAREVGGSPTGKNHPRARPAVCTVLEPGQMSVPTGAA